MNFLSNLHRFCTFVCYSKDAHNQAPPLALASPSHSHSSAGQGSNGVLRAPTFGRRAPPLINRPPSLRSCSARPRPGNGPGVDNYPSSCGHLSCQGVHMAGVFVCLKTMGAESVKKDEARSHLGGCVRILGQVFTFPLMSKHPELVEGGGLARPASFDRLRRELSRTAQDARRPQKRTHPAWGRLLKVEGRHAIIQCRCPSTQGKRRMWRVLPGYSPGKKRRHLAGCHPPGEV